MCLALHACRFVLCRAIFALHVDFRSESALQPSCSPDLPACASPTAPAIVSGIRQLARALDASHLFNVH